MLISHFVESFQSDLATLGRLGGEETAATLDRVAGAMGPALRSRLLEAVDTLVAEANAEPLGGTWHLALAGDSVSLVRDADAEPEVEAAAESSELSARFALRLPEDLKSQIEQHAREVGSSVNSWIVRVLAHEVAQSARRSAYRAGRQLRGTGRS